MSELKHNQWLCALPWVHFHQNADSCFSPCCNFVEDPALLPKPISYQEAFHSSYFQQVRRDFLEGKNLPEEAKLECRERFAFLAEKFRDQRKRCQAYSYIERFLQEPSSAGFDLFLKKHGELNRIRKIELAPVNDELRKWMQNFSEGVLARHGSVTL